VSLADLNQWWWPQPRRIEAHGSFAAPRTIALENDVHALIAADLARLTLRPSAATDRHAYHIRIAQDHALPPQNYRLAIDAQGAQLTGGDAAGCFYGQLTLGQYLALHQNQPQWPALHIDDGPAMARRGALIDLGRTVSNLPMLQQLVRVLARLRYNELHLRLYDDELCGLRFSDHPFGAENPFALTLAELGELAQHARLHHMDLVPELESWGHVGALVYHRPDLCGGQGVYGGWSFRAGPQAVSLMGELAGQVIAAAPRIETIHLGFDEANWYPGPDAPPGYAPEDYLLDLDRMRRELEQRRGRGLELRLWADHAGRPLPAALRGRAVLQPWQYWMKNQAMMDAAIARYEAAGEPWMMSLGQSQSQVRGAYQATRYFCRRASELSHLRGVTIAQWGWNDWSGQFLTFFAGGYYAWNPKAQSAFCDEQDGELFDQQVGPKLIGWRSLSEDAWNLDARRGPLVWNGRYVYGDRHGQPVAPTVTAARTFPQWTYMDHANPQDAAMPAAEVP
jgi:hypothetical protein